MNGLFCVDKPIGMTSFDVIAILRKKLNMKKIGHSGTLDPNASGCMLILMGSSTKLVPYIKYQSKHYHAHLQFGIRTRTADIWGEKIEFCDAINVSQEMIDAVLKSFVGKQKQLPPMVSAISIKGKRLYEYARQGIEVEREARDIEIFSLKGSAIKDGIEFDVHCSSGTYVRTLCEDIARAFDTIGTLSYLRRTQIESLKVEAATQLDQVSYDTISWLDPLKILDYPILELADVSIIYHGKRLEHEFIGETIMITHEHNLIAVYGYDEDKMNYKSIRGLW